MTAKTEVASHKLGAFMRRLVIIVPAFNEAARIEETVQTLKAREQTIQELGCELCIYVVDDGSEDGTGALALQAGADRVLRHRTNMGLGAAVRTGLMAARQGGADIALKFDADLQHDPDDIANIVAPIIAEEAEVIYGNRFERIEYRMPLVRRLGNLFFTALMRWLTGWPLRDSQPGIFAVDRTYLEQFRIPGDYNYTQQILLDAYHKGMRFAHVDVAFRKRATGKSFISLRYPFKVLPQIVMVLIGVKPMRIFGPIGLAFMALGTAVFCIEIGDWLIGESPKPVQSVNLVIGSVLFGLHTFFFGILAQLIVEMRK